MKNRGTERLQRNRQVPLRQKLENQFICDMTFYLRLNELHTHLFTKPYKHRIKTMTCLGTMVCILGTHVRFYEG